MLARIEILRNTPAMVVPNNLIQKTLRAEYLIQYYLSVLPYMPVQMDNDTSALGQQLPQKDSCLIEPLEVRINSSAPSVAVCLLFNDAWLFIKGLVVYHDSVVKVCPSSEGRIDVYKVYAFS